MSETVKIKMPKEADVGVATLRMLVASEAALHLGRLHWPALEEGTVFWGSVYDRLIQIAKRGY